MKKTFILIFFLILSLLNRAPSYAIEDPLSVPNNKVGIHIIDQSNIADAKRLINSTNGDWGYVTIVIPQNDRDKSKWQEIFDSLRRSHLIPIVRLATHVEGDSWAKAKTEDAKSWADFLNSLNWVTKNRYVILFNEPNHAKEWGGELNPREYAKVLNEYTKELKNKSDEFYILPAGLDASAPNGKETMDEELFIEYMNLEVPGVFNIVDGWSSHSYPNPNFSSSPYQTDRKSIRGYEWELETLKKHGLTKNLPVFITETGWAHEESVSRNTSFLDTNTVADYFQYAYQNVWNDSRIVAVTPFVLNYPQPPFDMFSWTKADNTFYPQYFKILELPKVKGEPSQKTDIKWKKNKLPKDLVTDSSYVFELVVQNDGQSILEKDSGFDVEFETLGLTNTSVDFSSIEPIRDGRIILKFHTAKERGNYTAVVRINRNGETLLEKKYTFTLIDPPSLRIQANAFFRSLDDETSSVIIYDKNEYVVDKYENLPLKEGVGYITNLRNIALGEKYRVVLLRPYYLPRQSHVVFTQGENTIALKPLLPFDPNLDGTFSLEDYITLIFHPFFTLSLIF